MTTKRIRTYLFSTKNIQFQNLQDVDCLLWRNFRFKLVEKMIRLPINKSSFTQPVRQKFSTNFFSEFLVSQSCFYKHSQWTTTANTKNRHSIPRDTKETSRGNRKDTLERFKGNFTNFTSKLGGQGNHWEGLPHTQTFLPVGGGSW